MLGVPDRVELEDLVAQLSTDGVQFESQTGGTKDGTLQNATKSKPVEIAYVIDHASRSIRIIAVRHRGDGPHASVTGASHA
jgi:hypothetical protein